jgi:hypothetical protein
VLTEKQRAWANAFLKVLGGQGEVKATTATPPSPRSKVKPPPELSGGLDTLDQKVDQPLREQRDKLAGVGEDIRRKKTIGYSSDRGFKKNVAEEVDKILKAVDLVLSRGGEVSEKNLPALNGLREKLVIQEQGYLKKQEGGKEDKLNEQRNVKAEAITERLKALDALILQSKNSQNVRMQKLTELDQTELDKLPDDRPETLKAAVTAKQVKLLDANPQLRKAVVGGKLAPDVLADLLSVSKNLDGLVADIVAAHAGDAAYMELLCERVLGNELKNGEKGGATFMRGNSAASKLTKAYAMTGDTQGFMEELAKGAQVGLTPSKKIEIDPNKEKDKEKRESGVKSLLGYVKALLNSVVGKEVPGPIATTSSMIAAGARKTGMGDADVAIMIGGHVFLRLINPMLTTMSGLDGDQKRSMILATKVLQNASNGITTSEKEPFMNAFADYINDELPTLHQWFLDIARQGDELRGIDDLDQVVSTGKTTRRDVLITTLDDKGYDPAEQFAQPSVDDPLGLKPAAPSTRIGKLIKIAVAAKPQPEGIQLPTTELGLKSHAKLVDRARREVIARVVDRLKRDAPSEE